MPYLPMLTDEELLRHCRTRSNDITNATELELELAKRLTKALEENSITAGAGNVLDEFCVDVSETAGIEGLREALQFQQDHEPLGPARELLAVLSEQDIDSAATLRKQFDRLGKFDQALQDLTDPLTQLQTLAAEVTA